ncbi:uncharacterized protein NECHADRAFT_88825 [Fusarium vanettenii 77-13-4]|uniref:Uncharacterized protein n=1 Tax=Fusarium vanettenii (strain ATCC MYA-4622 / CBS 123669 / FGSC 9596 / NRRL 45880 / 77-13-4) TaxID=660122 RepID=C7ZN67_FUSV7|nr:uncharacterized protein NECHADRAFT_88825 [Fusarium vanettenii 77-13-4]EEU34532.1 hypothetical protein NECHADRAFT_88825 [Fusarium vanettenii 77-13-4]
MSMHRDVVSPGLHIVIVFLPFIEHLLRRSNANRGPTCRLSKDSERADLVYTRLALDEPPKPLICKCKSAYESLTMVANKVSEALMSASIDVTDLISHKGTNVYKSAGMKVYVFCYTSGYIITQTDLNLGVIHYSVALIEGPIYELTDMPDLLVPELMRNGMLVYIDTLAVDGIALPKPRECMPMPGTRNVRPPMIIRRSWKSVEQMPPNPCMSMESDGIVCVTKSRTLRLKVPTIDLLYRNGRVYASETGKLIPIAEGHESMPKDVIYELTVTRGRDPNITVLSNPTMRLMKKRPNNTDIVRRAFTSIIRDSSVSTILDDVASMSFKMRKRTCEMAQTHASMGRHMIVSFGAGRLEEINEMMLDNFSYIAIDPNIDIKRLKKSRNLKRLVPYDVNRSMSK